MAASPDELERQHTLSTATTRYDELRMRDALATMAVEQPGHGKPLSREESLEMLALSEVVIRKAGYGRQAMVRAARGAGASWTQIGSALGSSKQAAWESHSRWIDEQGQQNDRNDHEGLAPDPERLNPDPERLDPDREREAHGWAGRPD